MFSLTWESIYNRSAREGSAFPAMRAKKRRPPHRRPPAWWPPRNTVSLAGSSQITTMRRSVQSVSPLRTKLNLPGGDLCRHGQPILNFELFNFPVAQISAVAYQPLPCWVNRTDGAILRPMKAHDSARVRICNLRQIELLVLLVHINLSGGRGCAYVTPLFANEYKRIPGCNCYTEAEEHPVTLYGRGLK